MGDRYSRWLPAELRTTSQHRTTWLDLPGVRLHVEVHGDDDPAHRVVLLHGAGGHAGMLRPYAAALARRGCRVSVPDLPGYGRTVVADPGGVRYEHWVTVACDLLRREDAARRATPSSIPAPTPRRLTVVGASMGGMLAYDAATRTGVVDTLVATCLLDPGDPRARRAISRIAALGPVSPALLAPVRGPVARLRVPVRWLTRMSAISNVPGLTRAVVTDPLGGGNRMPLGFLRSYLRSAPAVAPERPTGLRIVLAHPELDRWTPVDLSRRFLDRLADGGAHVVLRGAGHLPAEQPGVDELLDVVEAAGRA